MIYKRSSFIKYLSVCSGIEAATVAWKSLGFKPVAFSEIGKFPSALLKYYYPNTPNLGDMLEIDGEYFRDKVDVLVGGTPCQSFSVAGKRESLGDERGNLTLKFVNLADQINPEVIVYENVPGILNTKDNAFGCLLGRLAGEDRPLKPSRKRWTNAGYVFGPKRTIAWRILDAQYFGVAQRRRRLFLIGCPRNGADPRKILFECEGVRRDTAPSREKRKNSTHNVAPSITASNNPSRSPQSSEVTKQIEAVIEGQAVWRAGDQANSEVCYNLAGTLNTNQGQQGGILFEPRSQDGVCRVHESGVCPTLNCRSTQQGNAEGRELQVRKLTPRECERLQGFPDDFTNIPYGKPKHPDQNCLDGHRYKALGNSMCVNIMYWLGKRILENYT